MLDFKIQIKLNTTTNNIFHSWLSSSIHSKMTGSKATCTTEIGGVFTAWDGYIYGTNLELVPGKLIKQEWRTTDFNDMEPNSIILIELENDNNACLFTLIHTNIPDGSPDYRNGWEEYYFKPIREYFDEY